MGLFGRKQETLNEQLLREAGLDFAQVLGDPQPEPRLQTPRFGRVALPDGAYVDPKEWDAAVTVVAPGLVGDEVKFTTIPDGDVIVGEEDGDADLSPLADAVERRVNPPYRAVASRQEGDLWAVGAKRIQVARVQFRPETSSSCPGMAAARSYGSTASRPMMRPSPLSSPTWAKASAPVTSWRRRESTENSGRSASRASSP